jgi:hypothetical protein
MELVQCSYAFADENNTVVAVLLFEDTPDASLLAQVKEQLNAVEAVLCDSTRPISKGFIAINNKYYPPKPYGSWVLNEELETWDSPVEYPSDGKMYVWDESVIGWVEAVS